MIVRIWDVPDRVEAEFRKLEHGVISRGLSRFGGLAWSDEKFTWEEAQVIEERLNRHVEMSVRNGDFDVMRKALLSGVGQ